MFLFQIGWQLIYFVLCPSEFDLSYIVTKKILGQMCLRERAFLFFVLLSVHCAIRHSSISCQCSEDRFSNGSEKLIMPHRM